MREYLLILERVSGSPQDIISTCNLVKNSSLFPIEIVFTKKGDSEFEASKTHYTNAREEWVFLETIRIIPGHKSNKLI